MSVENGGGRLCAYLADETKEPNSCPCLSLEDEPPGAGELQFKYHAGVLIQKTNKELREAELTHSINHGLCVRLHTHSIKHNPCVG